MQDLKCLMNLEHLIDHISRVFHLDVSRGTFSTISILFSAHNNIYKSSYATVHNHSHEYAYIMIPTFISVTETTASLRKNLQITLIFQNNFTTKFHRNLFSYRRIMYGKVIKWGDETCLNVGHTGSESACRLSVF